MWIMLITKLPTKPSPPKLSIFWSEQHIVRENIYQQFIRYVEPDIDPEIFRSDSENYFFDRKKRKTRKANEAELSYSEKAVAYMMETQKNRLFFWVDDGMAGGVAGKDPNWVTARKILYKGTEIVVFGHEYSILTHRNMSLYIGQEQGEDASHVLESSGVASAMALENVLTGDAKIIYDAALTDGANHYQAQAMALGIDVMSDEPVGEKELAKFPAIGWYRPKPEYQNIFCTEEESKGD